VASRRESTSSAIADLAQISIQAHSLKDSIGEALAKFEMGLRYFNVSDRTHALESYQAALKILLSVGNPEQIANARSNIGIAYNELGDNLRALEADQLALQTFQKLFKHSHDKRLLLKVSDLQGAISIAYNNLGQNQKALDYANQALNGYTACHATRDIAREHGAIGGIFDDLGEYDKAVSNQKLGEKALLGLKNESDPKIRSSLAHIYENLAIVYSHLGNPRTGLTYLERALAKYKSLGASKRKEAADIQGDIGSIYGQIGQPSRAIDIFQSADSTYQLLKLPEGSAEMQDGLGCAYNALGQLPNALKHFQMALDDFERLRSPQDVARINCDIADVNLKQIRADDALSHFAKALPVFHIAGDRADESWVWHDIGRAMEFNGNWDFAIAAYKLSVDLRQSIRRDAKGLAMDLLQSLNTTNSFAYRDLANLLIERGRLSEAQRILGLLKDDEVNKFARTSDGQKVNFTMRESKWKKDFEDFGSNLASDQAELDAAASDCAKSLQPSPAQVARLDEAKRKVQQHADRTKAWLVAASLSIADRGARSAPAGDRITEIKKNDTELAGALSRLDGTAAIYALATADGVRTLLVLPRASDLVAGATQHIPASALNKKVALFRKALTDPHFDPRVLGADLYDILIRPIEKQLKESHSHQVIWSLDGPLRYLPLAALYDRDTKQYLIEKYSTSLFVPSDLGRLVEAPIPVKRAYGFGLTKGTTVHELPFNALPAVKGELDSIQRSFDAQLITDEHFTSASFETRLYNHPNLVHIATHFELLPGDEEGSFLVLGDKTAYSMKQFCKLKSTHALLGVDLLVLSACDTATPFDDAIDGSETESFTRIAVESGASSVLSTLWSVNDTSTSMLMGKFYQLRKNNPSIGKLEALRQAQRWLMTADGNDVAHHRSVEVTSSDLHLPTFKVDPKHPFAHPYYWAPFVLTGNTR
jgi:CHAT domain-containing protein